MKKALFSYCFPPMQSVTRPPPIQRFFYIPFFKPFLDRHINAFTMGRKVVNPCSDSIGDRIGNGGCSRNVGHLANPFCTKGPMDIRVLDVDGFDLRSIEGRWNNIILKIKVLDHSILHHDFFHQRIPQPHHHATFKSKFCHSRAGGNPEIGITKYMNSCFRRNDKGGLKDAAVMAYCFLF